MRFGHQMYPEMREAAKQKIKFEPEELYLAKRLVEKFTRAGLELSEYFDTCAKELKRLVDAKKKGKKIVIKPERTPEKPQTFSRPLRQVCRSKSPNVHNHFPSA